MWLASAIPLCYGIINYNFVATIPVSFAQELFIYGQNCNALENLKISSFNVGISKDVTISSIGVNYLAGMLSLDTSSQLELYP